MKEIEITLGQEYWEKGKFNFPKAESENLPNFPTEVKLILGKDSEQIVRGSFLFANEGGQNRVNDNPDLKKWFQKNYKKGEKVKIEIITPIEYKIY